MEAELSDKHKMCKPIAINEGRLNAKGRPLSPLNPLSKFYANLMPILRQNAITKSVFFNMGLTPPPLLNNVKKTTDLNPCL